MLGLDITEKETLNASMGIRELDTFSGGWGVRCTGCHLEEFFLPFLYSESTFLKHMFHLYLIFKKHREKNKAVPVSA